MPDWSRPPWAIALVSRSRTGLPGAMRGSRKLSVAAPHSTTTNWPRRRTRYASGIGSASGWLQRLKDQPGGVGVAPAVSALGRLAGRRVVAAVVVEQRQVGVTDAAAVAVHPGVGLALRRQGAGVGRRLERRVEASLAELGDDDRRRGLEEAG